MQSMTGCGKGSAQCGAWQVTVELKSVNHRFLDISCRLPRTWSFLEETVRKGLQAGLKRGHVEVYVTVEAQGEDAASREVRVDTALAARYVTAAREISQATGVAPALTMAELLAMDGVVQTAEAVPDTEAVTAAAEEAMRLAVEQLNTMRSREGSHLREDLRLHLQAAASLRGQILERAPTVVDDYRSRLTERLSCLPVEPVDPARLAQEVALMADKCAIDEELSRLESHIRQMTGYLDASGEIGKKMDFLVQEMNREANTIGSKASDAQIAQCVVDLKSEIEKLREQIQNVE